MNLKKRLPIVLQIFITLILLALLQGCSNLYPPYYNPYYTPSYGNYPYPAPQENGQVNNNGAQVSANSAIVPAYPAHPYMQQGYFNPANGQPIPYPTCPQTKGTPSKNIHCKKPSKGKFLGERLSAY